MGSTSEFGFRDSASSPGDWYWEQDSQLRLTFMSCRPAEKPGVDLAAYLGRKRWDQPALNLTQAGTGTGTAPRSSATSLSGISRSSASRTTAGWFGCR